MLSIQECLDNFMNAIYGKEVRQSLHDSVKQSYEYAKDANDTAHAVEKDTEQLLTDASQALKDANDAVDAANTAVDTANTASQTALEAAQKAEDAAANPGEFLIDYTDSEDTPEEALEKITPGAKLKDLVSNIKAVLKGAVLLSSIANNLTTTEAGKVLAAGQGKVLSDRIAALNNNLAAAENKYTALNKTLTDLVAVNTVTPVKFTDAGLIFKYNYIRINRQGDWIFIRISGASSTGPLPKNTETLVATITDAAALPGYKMFLPCVFNSGDGTPYHSLGQLTIDVDGRICAAPSGERNNWIYATVIYNRRI